MVLINSHDVTMLVECWRHKFVLYKVTRLTNNNAYLPCRNYSTTKSGGVHSILGEPTLDPLVHEAVALLVHPTAVIDAFHTRKKRNACLAVGDSCGR